MHELALTAGLAVALFVSTNIDELFILLAFLVDRRLRFQQVVMGQFLGMGLLFAFSVVASQLSLVIPTAWIGLLGLAPLAIGAKQAWDLRQNDKGEEESGGSVAPGSTWAVAAVTIANGGDNLGVYIPVFANQPGTAVTIFGVTFAAMTWLWLVAARWLISHPTLGAPIRRYGERIAPFVLMALGLWIFHEAGTWSLL